MEGILYSNKKKKGDSTMDSSAEIKAIRLYQTFKSYDLAIYHSFEMLEIYWYEKSSKMRNFWKDVIEHLTTEKRKYQIDNPPQKTIWINFWLHNTDKTYFTSICTREDLADLEIEEELSHQHLHKIRIKL